jgi:hypothetical protein
VFNPILRARRSDYNDSQQRKLADVQQATRSEKQRFRGYRSAEDVRTNFLSDLHSETAKRINHELHELKLPRLSDVKEEFLALAEGRRRDGEKTRTAGGE